VSYAPGFCYLFPPVIVVSITIMAVAVLCRGCASDDQRQC